MNRATEKAFALRVNTVRLKKSQILTRLTLDDEAMVSDSGLSIKGRSQHRTRWERCWIDL